MFNTFWEGCLEPASPISSRNQPHPSSLLHMSIFELCQYFTVLWCIHQALLMFPFDDFPVWHVDTLILYKLFIGLISLPLLFALLRYKDWISFKQEQAMFFCYFCTFRVEILRFVGYKENQLRHYCVCHRVEPKWKYFLGKEHLGYNLPFWIHEIIPEA